MTEQAVEAAEQALQTARSITHPDSQSSALAKVAGALARAGHAEQALEVAPVDHRSMAPVAVPG